MPKWEWTKKSYDGETLITVLYVMKTKSHPAQRLAKHKTRIILRRTLHNSHSLNVSAYSLMNNFICKCYYSDGSESPKVVRRAAQYFIDCSLVWVSQLSTQIVWIFHLCHKCSIISIPWYSRIEKRAKFKSLWILEEILRTLQKLWNLLTCIKWI